MAAELAFATILGRGSNSPRHLAKDFWRATEIIHAVLPKIVIRSRNRQIYQQSENIFCELYICAL